MIQLQEIDQIPEETARIARLAFPKGNTCIKMRDAIGTIFRDKDFEALFSTRGQPAFSPWRLALVCVLQYIKGKNSKNFNLISKFRFFHQSSIKKYFANSIHCYSHP
jgi:hypothetical protein